jgi:hypothetical protein
MPFSLTYEHGMLEHAAGKTDWGSLNNFYVGLTKNSCTKSAGGAEPTGGAYARVQIVAGSWASAATSQIKNSAEIEFPQATADWEIGVDLVYAVYYTAASGGTYIGYQALTTAKSVVTDQTAKFAVNALVLGFGS